MNRIAVLMGGVSAEREVSLTTGRAVCEALTKLGYAVDPIDVGSDIPALAARLTPPPTPPSTPFTGASARMAASRVCSN